MRTTTTGTIQTLRRCVSVIKYHLFVCMPSSFMIDYNFTLADLFKAYFDCRKHKRCTRSALEFELNLEQNLLELYKEIKSGNYQIGHSICFVVTKPKPREIWAANFRDRIVHHLVYNFISERFYKRFIFDTYSCIPKKGTLAAAKRLLRFSRSVSLNYTKPAFYLKADLSNFFVSIDKNILFSLLQKQVNEPWLLCLLKKIIFHKPVYHVIKKSSPKLFALIPPYKSLFNTPYELGLPIGNLTSQFFSNVYLDIMDKFVKEQLKCKYYIRYVDDFIILAHDTNFLNYCYLKISSFILSELKIKIHPRKKLVNNIKHGMLFLGYDIKPHRILLCSNTINRMFYVVKMWLRSFSRFNTQTLFKFFKTANSYLGMLVHLNGFRVRCLIGNSVSSLFIFPNEAFSKFIISAA